MSHLVASTLSTHQQLVIYSCTYRVHQ